MRAFTILLVVLASTALGRAEPPPAIAVNAGLIQPLLLGGANIEVDARWKWLVVAYSHGWNLSLDRGLGREMDAQHVTLDVPYTTGLGIGATLPLPTWRSLLDARLEVKVHRFLASYASDDGLRQTRFADYRTFTVGAGVYWTVMPFRGRRDALRGLDLSTSIRYWPNVATSLADDEVRYANATTGQDEIHHAANIGMANTPLIVNVSVGYVFP